MGLGPRLPMICGHLGSCLVGALGSLCVGGVGPAWSLGWKRAVPFTWSGSSHSRCVASSSSTYLGCSRVAGEMM
eukprot:1455602-Pyramimonas_sp.AAC.1